MTGQQSAQPLKSVREFFVNLCACGREKRPKDGGLWIGIHIFVHGVKLSAVGCYSQC